MALLLTCTRDQDGPPQLVGPQLPSSHLAEFRVRHTRQTISHSSAGVNARRTSPSRTSSYEASCMAWAVTLVLAGGAAMATAPAASAGASVVSSRGPPEEAFRTGDLVFVRPPLNIAQPLDAAILATGNATVQWLKDHGVSECWPRTITVATDVNNHGAAVHYLPCILVGRGHHSRCASKRDQRGSV